MKTPIPTSVEDVVRTSSGPGTAKSTTIPIGMPSQYAHMSGCHSPARNGASAVSGTTCMNGCRGYAARATATCGVSIELTQPVDDPLAWLRIQVTMPAITATTITPRRIQVTT